MNTYQEQLDAANGKLSAAQTAAWHPLPEFNVLGHGRSQE